MGTLGGAPVDDRHDFLSPIVGGHLTEFFKICGGCFKKKAEEDFNFCKQKIWRDELQIQKPTNGITKK